MNKISFYWFGMNATPKNSKTESNEFLSPILIHHDFFLNVWTVLSTLYDSFKNNLRFHKWKVETIRVWEVNDESIHLITYWRK